MKCPRENHPPAGAGKHQKCLTQGKDLGLTSGNMGEFLRAATGSQHGCFQADSRDIQRRRKAPGHPLDSLARGSTAIDCGWSLSTPATATKALGLGHAKKEPWQGPSAKITKLLMS